MPLAAVILCLVVGISDGDTMTIRCSTPMPDHPYQQVKVRLAEIDAPELGQSFGQRSKQHLSDLCYQAQAMIRPSGTVRYGRLIARVECRGKDASMDMVRAGMAWTYTKYQTDPVFTQLEQEARASRTGLWAETGQSPPWLWRRGTPVVSGDAAMDRATAAGN